MIFSRRKRPRLSFLSQNSKDFLHGLTAVILTVLLAAFVRYVIG